MRRRTTNNRGGAQAVWLGRLPLLYERGAIIARLLRWPACTLDPQLVTDCGMRVTVEHYQRDALTSHAQATRHRCGLDPSSCRINAGLYRLDLAPHSPPLRRRMRLRARGAPSDASPGCCECSPRPRPRVPRSDRPPLPAFSVRSPSWDPRDREPRAESEVPPERAERPRPPREAPRDPPREPRPRPSRRGDEPPRSSNTSASRPARVRLARGRRPVVPSGISRSVNRWGEVW